MRKTRSAGRRPQPARSSRARAQRNRRRHLHASPHRLHQKHLSQAAAWEGALDRDFPGIERIAIVFGAQRRKVERRFRHPWPASWRYFFAAFFKASFGAGGFRIASASCR